MWDTPDPSLGLISVMFKSFFILDDLLYILHQPQPMYGVRIHLCVINLIFTDLLGSPCSRPCATQKFVSVSARKLSTQWSNSWKNLQGNLSYPHLYLSLLNDYKGAVSAIWNNQRLLDGVRLLEDCMQRRVCLLKSLTLAWDRHRLITTWCKNKTFWVVGTICAEKRWSEGSPFGESEVVTQKRANRRGNFWAFWTTLI